MGKEIANSMIELRDMAAFINTGTLCFLFAPIVNAIINLCTTAATRNGKHDSAACPLLRIGTAAKVSLKR
jgi:uncharacterized membrane protein